MFSLFKKMGNAFSIRNNRESNDWNYLIQANDSQIDRLQQLHHILKGCCHDTNYFSPISQDLTRGMQVLDIGSGPGTWVFDMSSDFPNSEFTGIELRSNVLPTIKPSNTRFLNDNLLQGIPFPPNSFDYIHMRLMAFSFTELQYEEVMKQMADILRPDGYLEVGEVQMCSENKAPAGKKFSEEMDKLLKKRSMNPNMGDRLHEIMKDLGLQQIRRETIMLPLSELDGELGELYGKNVLGGLIGVKDVLAKQMKISKSEMNRLLNQFYEETKTTRMYCKYTRIYGKKV